MGIQAVFAIIANSESMLADSEAMSVDALTYLFNLCAGKCVCIPSFSWVRKLAHTRTYTCIHSGDNRLHTVFVRRENQESTLLRL